MVIATSDVVVPSNIPCRIRFTPQFTFVRIVDEPHPTGGFLCRCRFAPDTFENILANADRPAKHIRSPG